MFHFWLCTSLYWRDVICDFNVGHFVFGAVDVAQMLTSWKKVTLEIKQIEIAIMSLFPCLLPKACV